MAGIFDLPAVTESEKTEHEQGVQRMRTILTRLNLPLLPPHIVYCDSYHPDLSTRIRGERFVLMDYVNSAGQFNFDIGGLALLLMHKDIIEVCIAVVNPAVYPELRERVKRHRSPVLEHLLIVAEDELETALRGMAEGSALWRPEDLK